MSNYTPTTAFGPKDTLPTSNPLKTIYGAQFDTEFNNIATAISSKYDTNTTTISVSGVINAGSFTQGNKAFGPAAYVSAGQSITSSTTLTNATGVSATLAANATYFIQFKLLWNGALLSGTQGYKFGFTYSGTLTTSAPSGIVTLSGNGVLGSAQISASLPVTSTNISTSTTSPDFCTVDIIVNTNTTGTINLQIAQASSSTYATTLNPGSAMIVTRLT
jgi:hypothetical protein